MLEFISFVQNIIVQSLRVRLESAQCIHDVAGILLDRYFVVVFVELVEF